MKSIIDTFLSKLDNSVRWTGIATGAADQMSGNSSGEPKYRLFRWMPIWSIVLSCAVFVIFLIWPPVLDRISLGAFIAVLVSFICPIVCMVPIMYAEGPLGKSSYKDDEREATLRKDSFLFCFGLLTWLNCLGQPTLMILSHFQNWQTSHSLSVAASAFVLNAILFGCLPTLYASWKLRQMSKE